MKKFGFTLAEVMITLAVLGTVAAITIPTAFNRYTLSKQRTQIKKAIASHQNLLQSLQIDSRALNMNTLTTAAGASNGGNCNGLRQRLKVKETDNTNSCIVKAPSGLWYNYSNLGYTIVAFKREDLTEAKASNANDNSAFYFVSAFDQNKNLNVLNPAFERNGTSYYNACNKVYGFIRMRTTPKQ